MNKCRCYSPMKTFQEFLYIYSSLFDLPMAQCQYLIVTGRDGGLSTLCHSCRFACQHRVLQILPGTGYFQSKDGVVRLWYFLVNLNIQLTIRSCYCSIPVLYDWKTCGLSNLCHSCQFGCQLRVLKHFLVVGIATPRMGQSDFGIFW